MSKLREAPFQLNRRHLLGHGSAGIATLLANPIRVAVAQTPIPSPTVTTSIGDVPMFRGDPARTGTMPGPGPEGSPVVRWKTEISDSIYATAAVVGGVAFIASDTSDVAAVDVETGEILWRVNGVGGYSSPAVVDGLVVFGDIDGSAKPGGRVIALDAMTGAVVWEAVTLADIYSAPVVSAGRIFIQDDEGTLYALALDSGNEFWRVRIGAQGGNGPSVSDDTVYIGGIDTGELLAFDAMTGGERWRVKLGDAVLSSAAVVGSMVYTSAGTISGESAIGDLIALDTVTGRERWRSRLPSFSNSSPAVVDGAVYIGDVAGMMSCFDEESGETIWQTMAGRYVSLSSPGVVDGCVYLMAAGVVVALDAVNGDIRWRFTIGPGSDDVDASPVVTGGLVIIGGGDGILYALGDPA